MFHRGDVPSCRVDGLCGYEVFCLEVDPHAGQEGIVESKDRPTGAVILGQRFGARDDVFYSDLLMVLSPLKTFASVSTTFFNHAAFQLNDALFFGKSVDMSTCIRDLARENCRLSFHFVACQRGGGAKIDHRNECKTALAKELLGHDFPLGGIDALVDRWIEKLGANRILKALQERHDDRRWISLIELAKVHGLPYVPSDPVRTRAASIIQRAVRKAKPLHVKAEDFTLCDGFFHNI